MQPPRNPLPRILLVEDHIPNQAVIKAQLRILGFDCDTACNGLEGLQRLEAQDYDLILMDCKMPVMDGYEATRRIRQNPKTAHIPIIAITAYAFMSDRERCLALGMNDYLAKPYWLDDLKVKLQAWICDSSETPAEPTPTAPSANSSAPGTATAPPPLPRHNPQKNERYRQYLNHIPA